MEIAKYLAFKILAMLSRGSENVKWYQQENLNKKVLRINFDKKSCDQNLICRTEVAPVDKKRVPNT